MKYNIPLCDYRSWYLFIEIQGKRFKSIILCILYLFLKTCYFGRIRNKKMLDEFDAYELLYQYICHFFIFLFLSWNFRVYILSVTYGYIFFWYNTRDLDKINPDIMPFCIKIWNTIILWQVFFIILWMNDSSKIFMCKVFHNTF